MFLQLRPFQENLSEQQIWAIKNNASLALGMGEVAKTWDESREKSTLWMNQLEKSKVAAHFMTQEMWENSKVTQQFVMEWKQAAEAGYDFADAEVVAEENTKRLKAETEKFNSSLDKLHFLMDGPVGKAIDGFREKVDQAKESIKEAQESLFPLDEKLMETFSPEQ